MHPVLRIIRTGNTVVSFVGVVVGGLVAEGNGLAVPLPVYATLALAGLSAAMVTAGGNVLNDLGDREGDRVNHPDRPLVTGALSVANARLLCGGLLVGSALVAVPVALHALWIPVILAAALAALLTYELRFKALGLAGNLLVAFLTAAVFLYGGAAVGNPALLAPFAVMAFGATLSREVIKDMEDAEGDVDRRTLPRTHGLGIACGVARGAVGVAIALSPVPLVTFVPLASAAGIIYLVSVLAADALFVVSVATLPRELHRAQSVSKGAMTVALIAFLAAAFR